MKQNFINPATLKTLKSLLLQSTFIVKILTYQNYSNQFLKIF